MAKAFNCAAFSSLARIHTSSVFSSGLSVNLISSPNNSPVEGLVYNLGEPLPQAQKFYFELPSIHASNFFEELMILVNALLSSVPNARFNLMIQATLPSGAHRTVGSSFNINVGTTLEELEKHLLLSIENFEAQPWPWAVQDQAQVQERKGLSLNLL
jgi:hypothetical protein